MKYISKYKSNCLKINQREFALQLEIKMLFSSFHQLLVSALAVKAFLHLVLTSTNYFEVSLYFCKASLTFALIEITLIEWFVKQL